MTARSNFAAWQPRYAAHGVATFPVVVADGNKRPAITGYDKIGLPGSYQLAIKFAEARSFGFMAGGRNRLTVLDLDDTDPAILKESERLFGPSPLVWRTGSGKFAAAFRHNGERRRIRPIPALPIDLLGGGVVVAPGSMGAHRKYQIIRGNLDDLERLPVARMPDEIACQAASDEDRAGRIPEGTRNNELFRYCKSVVGYCDTLDQLTDAAMTFRDNRLALWPPVSDNEIAKTARSVWEYQGGRRKIMHCIIESQEFEALAADPECLGVVAFLAAENGPAARFMIADGLGEKLGWPRRLLPAARKRMITLGLIEPVGRQGRNGPRLYRWRRPPA